METNSHMRWGDVSLQKKTFVNYIVVRAKPVSYFMGGFDVFARMYEKRVTVLDGT